MAYDAAVAGKIIAEFDARPELLVQILHRYMQAFASIDDDAVRGLADALNLSRAEVHGVVSYYHDFRPTPAGKHTIRICAAESCQAMGSRELSEHASAVLGIGMHETNADVTLEPVYCLGNCACSPAIMVDGKTYGRVTPTRLDAIVATFKGSH